MSNRDQSGGRAPNKTLKLKARAEGPSPSELPQNLRLKPLVRDLKVYVSENTLPQFQFENDSAATYLTTSVEVVPREIATNPVEHQAILKNIASGFDLTVDYAGSIDQLLSDAKNLYLARLRKELDRLSAIIPSLADKYPSFAAEQYLALVDSDDAIAELTSRIEASPYNGVFAHFDALYGQEFWTEHGIDHSPCDSYEDPFEQTTILSESKVYRFFRDQHPASHVMPAAPEAKPLVVLRDVGKKILDIAKAQEAEGIPATTLVSDSVCAEIRSLVDGLNDQIHNILRAHQEAEEQAFLDQAHALIAISDSEHLRESINQGFPSRATFFSIKQQAIVEFVTEQIVAALTEACLLDGFAVTVNFRNSNNLGPTPLPSAKNPSLASLKAKKLLEQLFTDEATLKRFRLSEYQSISITYIPNEIHYGRAFEGADPAVCEYVTVDGLFEHPLLPKLDQLTIKLSSKAKDKP